jgi:hypothetical protein
MEPSMPAYTRKHDRSVFSVSVKIMCVIVEKAGSVCLGTYRCVSLELEDEALGVADSLELRKGSAETSV